MTKITAKDRVDKMVDAILTLRGLGLEPTGFSMDSDLLWDLSNIATIEFADSNGIFNMREVMDNYSFSILGIPIEPDWYNYGIRARRNKENE